MKVLFLGQYSDDGRKGLRESNLEKRREVAAGLAETVGGELLEMFFVRGDIDVVAVGEMPDEETTLAFRDTLLDSGAWLSFEVMMEVDVTKMNEAFAKIGAYKKPGTE